MSESQSENPPQPQDGENQTPTKRTPSKRVSRAQRESEELIKTMGGSLDVEGGRKTRSSARGSAPSTPSTPPPAKKARTATTPRRGRPKRSEVSLASSEEVDEPTTPTKKTDKEEANADKLQENCNKEDATKTKTADKGKSDGKSKTDSKVNCNEEAASTESIDEKGPDDEKTDECKADTAAPKLDEADAPVDAVVDDDDETKTSEKEEEEASATPAAAAADPVEPMEVDSAPVKQTNESATINAKQPESEAPHTDEKNETKNDESNAIEIKSSSSDDDSAVVEVTHANSIGEKPIANDKNETVVADEKKIEESKKENDVCSEPKISSPTNPAAGDVVAAQPCN